jgi:hypothetical protein
MRCPKEIISLLFEYTRGAPRAHKHEELMYRLGSKATLLSQYGLTNRRFLN